MLGNLLVLPYLLKSSSKGLSELCTEILQEEIENKIEIADALAMKLLQRLNYSVSAMKTTSQNLSEGRCLIIEHCTLSALFYQNICWFYWWFFYQLLVSFGFTLEHVVHALQVEIGELKGRLTEVISNCDALCRRIATEGPESLRSSIKPFAVAVATPENGSSSSSLQGVIQFQRNPPSETKLDWYFGPSFFFFFSPLSLYTFEIQVLTYWSHLFDSLFNVLGSK